MTTLVTVEVKQTNAPTGKVLVGVRMHEHINTKVFTPPVKVDHWVTDASEVFVTEATEADVARHAPTGEYHGQKDPS